jgi:type IV secretion system protein VirB6
MFDILFTMIDQITLTNIGSMVGAMISVIKPLIGASVVLYALYIAYQAMFDSQNMLVMESLRFMAALALVATVAFSAGWYQGNIVPIVLNSGDDIAQALLGVTTSSAQLLQIMINKLFLQIDAVWDSMDISFLSPGSMLDALVKAYQVLFLVIGAIPFIAICTAYLVVAKIMVSFLLIIGPLFICFSFFPSTRDFFKAWTGQCFNYILLSVLFPIAFALFGQILDETTFAGNLTSGSILSGLVLNIVLIFVAVQIPTLCSSLSGGVGINGIVGNIAGVGRVLSGGKGDKDKDNGTGKQGALGKLVDKIKNRGKPDITSSAG